MIEDRVDLGCGVCVLGDVVVGHDSVVGANSVVLRDVPPHSVAAGIPARVVRRLEAESPEHGHETLSARASHENAVQAGV